MKKLIFPLVLMFLWSCSDESTIGINNSDSNKETESKHYVSYEEALKSAISFMTDNAPSSRANSSFKVKSHYEYSADNTTRGIGEDTIDIRFHIINYEDNGGFTLVAADDRTTSIYAYSYEGQLDIEEAIEHTGFGVFIDNAKRNYIREINESDDSFPHNRLDPNPDYNYWVTQLPRETVNGVEYYVYGYFSTISYKSPMLVTAWDQCDPYNYYSPPFYGSDPKYNNKAAAGCGPIAMAQIFAYHERPLYNSNLILIPWSTIKSQASYSVGDYSNNILMAAEVISQIQARAAAEYGNGWNATTTYIDEMPDVLEEFDYSSSDAYYGYFGVPGCPLQVSLNNNMPVYARGERLVGGGGHAWVIDGYNYQQKFYSYYYTTYPYNFAFSTESLQYKPYFHCNWGWGGLYNAFCLGFSPDGTVSDRRNVNNAFIYNIHPNNN